MSEGPRYESLLPKDPDLRAEEAELRKRLILAAYQSKKGSLANDYELRVERKRNQEERIVGLRMLLAWVSDRSALLDPSFQAKYLTEQEQKALLVLNNLVNQLPAVVKEPPVSWFGPVYSFCLAVMSAVTEVANFVGALLLSWFPVEKKPVHLLEIPTVGPLPNEKYDGALLRHAYIKLGDEFFHHKRGQFEKINGDMKDYLKTLEFSSQLTPATPEQEERINQILSPSYDDTDH